MEDLFNKLETLPTEVQEIIGRYSLMDDNYLECEALLNELENVGYTFDYYLDATPYNLRKLTKICIVRYNVGRAKYVVNYHDGIKQHKDGSKFFDIEILKNIKALNNFINKLKSEGYEEV